MADNFKKVIKSCIIAIIIVNNLLLTIAVEGVKQIIAAVIARH